MKIIKKTITPIKRALPLMASLVLTIVILTACLPQNTAQTTVTTGTEATTASQTTVTATTEPAESFMPNGGEYRKISPEEAFNWLSGDEPPFLLDVRTAQEYEEGHIEGSVLIPVSELAARIAELPQDKDAPIVIYCRSGRRSADATPILFAQGYTNVYDLGGIISWPYEIVVAD